MKIYDGFAFSFVDKINKIFSYDYKVGPSE